MLKDLKISLTSWDDIVTPHVKYSALCTTTLDYLSNSFLERKIDSIITVGTFTGEIIRWIEVGGREGFIPFNVSFAHSTKIISIKNCTNPGYTLSTASLSLDGTLCIWSTIDGICLAKYENLFPEGCQMMEAFDEYLAIAGAFPLVYIFNINEGKIVKVLHPTNRYTVALSFIKSKEVFLFNLDCKGSATYTCVNDETKTCKVQLTDPNKTLLQARVSPNFNYLLSLYTNSFVVTNLLVQGFPSITVKFANPMNCVWVNNTKFTIVSYVDPVVTYILIDGSSVTPEHCEETHTKLISFISGKDIFDLGPSVQAPQVTKPEPIQITDNVTINGGTLFTCLTSYKNTTIIGYGDSMFFLPTNKELTNMREASLSTFFKEHDDMVTSQCLEVSDKSCIHLPDKTTKEEKTIKSIIDGTEKGNIRITNIKDKTCKEIKGIHNGPIVQICTLEQYLFIAYADFSVVVYDLIKEKVVHIFQHFISPITLFCMPEKPTNSISDHFLFCLTKKGNISVIDAHDFKRLFAFTGHDGDVQGIYIHPATDMLIVNAKSLYFWSMRTGNLESIVNGNMKYTYLREFEKSLIKVVHFGEAIEGFVFEQLEFGGRSMRVIDVDVKITASKIHDILFDGEHCDLKDIIPNMPNFPLVAEVLTNETLNYINSISGTNYKQTMQMGFVGDKQVHTVYLYKNFRKVIKDVSSNVSAILLSTKIIYAVSLSAHPQFFEKMKEMFSRQPDFEHLKVPSVVALFRYVSEFNTRFQEMLIKVIKLYPEEIRKRWYKNLRSFGDKCILLHDALSFAYLGVGTTILHDLSEEDKIDIASKIAQFIGSKKFNCFASNLYRFNIEQFENFKTATKKAIEQTVVLYNETGDESKIERLNFYIERVPHIFLTEMVENCKENGNMKIAAALFHQVVKNICKEKSRSQYTAQFITTIIEKSFVFPKDFVKSLLIQMSEAHTWFSFKPEANLVAYCSGIVGTMFITKFVGNRLISAIISITKEPIRSVTIDKTGKFIIAFCVQGDVGIMHFFAYTVETNGNDLKLTTEEFAQKQCSKDSQFIRIKDDLSIVDANGKSTTIDAQAAYNEYVEKNKTPKETNVNKTN